MNIIPGSLYDRLLNGQYLLQFPEGYFPKITHIDGKITMPSCRWVRENNIETYYEWTIPIDANNNVIEDFMNSVIILHPNITLLVLRSRQNSPFDVSVRGIFDMSSTAFTHIFINTQTGAVTNSNIKPSTEYRWRSSASPRVRDDTGTLVEKLIPASKDIMSNEIYTTILSNVRNGSMELPSIL